MIMTVDFLRRFIQSEEDDQALEARLQALELLIQGYTNNDFKRHLSADGEYPMDVKMGVQPGEKAEKHDPGLPG